MYYVEYFRRREGMALDEFRRRTTPLFREWSRREREDELIASLGRTWRMGPDPYILVWRCRGVERIDEWNAIFSSSAVDDIEKPILEAMETYRSGFYREVIPAAAPLDSGFYYFESHEPWDGAGESYGERAADVGGSAVLVGARVGLLGPEPGGLALVAVPTLACCEHLQRTVTPHSREAGLFAPIGEEIL